MLGRAPLTTDVLGVAVVEGRAPEPWEAACDEAPYWWADADRLLFTIDTARVYAEADTVVIDAPTADDRAAADWLLYATAARAVLTFRRRYNLHATLVVASDGSGIAVLGESTVGKSTTTAELVRRGWAFACDDIVEVEHTTRGPVAHPVERPIHLSDDVARRLGGDPADGRLLPLRDKRAYAVTGADLTPRPLTALVVLSTLATGPDVESCRVAPLDALATVAAATDRYGICQLPEHRADFLRWNAELCRQVPVWAVRRPRYRDTTEAVTDAVAAIAEGRSG